ncbi:MAG: membrane-associated protein [Bacteroidota bacterium]
MIPVWLKIAYTVLTIVVVTVYSRKYGPKNFLWFSDIALILTVPALWLENRLLASMMVVGVLLPEIFWNVSYFLRLLTGIRLTGLTDYMFDRKRPRFLRGLSLFHIVLPAVIVYLVLHLGYDPRAFVLQTLLAWLVLPATYLLTGPDDNINWVYGVGGDPQQRIPELAYLAIVMMAFPVFVFLPTHLLLLWVR